MSPSCFSPPDVVGMLVHANGVSSSCMARLMNDPVVPDISFAQYFLYFSLTCILEAPIYWLAARRFGKGSKEILLLILGLNLATHPIVVFVMPRISLMLGQSSLFDVSSSEVFAPVVEALLLWRVGRFPMVWAIPVAIAANLCSWWLGSYLF